MGTIILSTTCTMMMIIMMIVFRLLAFLQPVSGIRGLAMLAVRRRDGRIMNASCCLNSGRYGEAPFWSLGAWVLGFPVLQIEDTSILSLN